MKKNNFKKSDEINLSKFILIIWKKKISILLITLISIGIGLFYGKDIKNKMSYEVSIEIQESKISEFIKFLPITSMLNEIQRSEIEIKSEINKYKTRFMITPENILNKFLNEIRDYEEVTKVLSGNALISENLSQLSIKDKQTKLYQYGRLFSVEKSSSWSRDENNAYILKFKWHEENEALQILDEILKLTLANLSLSIFEELDQLVKMQKTSFVIEDIKRVNFLLEQSEIAKELGIADNKFESMNLTDTNSVFHYLRGYKAIDKEIKLITKRKYHDLINIEEEINYLRKTDTDWVFYNILFSKVQKNVQNDKTKIIILFVLFGLIVGVIFALISDKFKPYKKR